MVHARHAVASILRAAYGAAVARESRTRLAASAGALVLTASLTWGPQAHAQQAPASSSSDQEQTQQLQEVEVTGSRIKRTSDFSTPTPTTVLDASTMESAGIVNVGQALQMAPANISTLTPANTGNSPYFVGSYIANLRGLNPYFGTRTLTLVDTQRAVQTTQGDSFDLNFIPQVLVSRIDTVTGGGSAAYGSGAISGVINVILDRKLEGGKITGDLYQTNHDDARDRHLGAAYGFDVADNRVHVVLGGEYERQGDAYCENNRSWCANNAAYYRNGTVLGTAGPTAVYGYGSGLHQATMNYNGVLTRSAFGFGTGLTTYPGQTPFYQSTPDGTAAMGYTAGETPYAGAAAGSTSVVGGDGFPLNQYTDLTAPTQRGILTALITSKITDNTTLKVDLNWGKVEAGTHGSGNPTSGDVIKDDNAYIGTAGSLYNTVATNGYNYLYKDWNEQSPLTVEMDTTMRRATVGLDGRYGESSWTWDGYAEYGLTNREQHESNESKYMSMYMALDTVINPATGQPECRVTAEGFAAASVGTAYAGANPLLANGCVPINPFGTNALSSAQKAYAFGDLVELLRYSQTVVAFNSTGDIFKGIGAGAWSAAAGVEWRQEVGHNDDNDLLGVGCLSTDNAATCTARSQDYAGQYGTSFGGSTTVKEGFLELNLPLAKDLPFAHLLNLDVAARESQYETQAFNGIAYTENPDLNREGKHNLFTWKASLAWEPVEGFRVRASQSRDARAANFREMYYGQAVNDPGFYGFCIAPNAVNDYTHPCTGNLFGNVNLAPETSDTTTAGIVLTPPQVPGLQFSADFIHIRINNAISAASTTFTVNQELATGGPTVAGSVNFDPSSGCGTTYSMATCLNNWKNGVAGFYPTSINALAYNGAFYDERGTDFSLSYLIPSLPDGSSLMLRSLATWTSEQKYQAYPGSPVVDILGQTGASSILTDYTPAARWRGNVSLTWTKGMLSLTPIMTWVGHGTQAYNAVTPDQTALYQLVANKDSSVASYGYILADRNYVPSYFKFDLNATLDLGEKMGLKNLQLFTQINNVLNKTPPAAGGFGGFFGATGYAGTNPIYFDTMGLAYRIGFRATF